MSGNFPDTTDPNIRAARHRAPDGSPISLARWIELTEAKDDRDDTWWRKRTQVGEATISTVWIGIGLGDPPMIFETMIFGGPRDGAQWRYPTECEAWAGHERVCAEERRGRLPEIMGAWGGELPRA